MALNDTLQRALRLHDDIVKGIADTGTRETETSVLPLVNVNHEEDELEDDFAQLAHRYDLQNFCTILNLLLVTFSSLVNSQLYGGIWLPVSG